ncbi:MAG TPA: hemin uptake protein HemP [Alphaproteobacteria bacterium]
MPTDPHTELGRSRATPAAPPVRRLPLDSIMAGSREVIIEHRGQDYRLRVTSNGKLLLTK